MRLKHALLALAYESLELGAIPLLLIELAFEALVDAFLFSRYLLEIVVFIVAFLSNLIDELQSVE